MTDQKNEVKGSEDKPEPTVEVILRKSGVKSCGPYQAGQIYQVNKKEAERLVNNKGFEKVTAQLKKSLEAEQTEKDGENK